MGLFSRKIQPITSDKQKQLDEGLKAALEQKKRKEAGFVDNVRVPLTA